MVNTIKYFQGASWAVVTGAFTSAELREIADKIDNPELREEVKEEETKEG